MPNKTLAFVGCLNRGTPYFQGARGTGIAVFAFDDETGALTFLGETAGVDNPTYLTLDVERGRLYATSEVAGWNEGIVTAYRIDPEHGTLTYLNKQPTLGSIAAHASIDHSGRNLLVADYTMGQPDDLPGQQVAVFPIRADGGLAPASSSHPHHGSGPNVARQEGPHAHCAVASPDNRFVFVCDLGIDQIVRYRLDAEAGRLTPDGGTPTAAGAGPRHFVFHPNGRFAFVINELDSTITAYAYGAADGSFRAVETVPALPAGYAEESHCADIHLSVDGRFLYGSNRGHDSIVIHAVDPETGRLTLVGHTPTEGRTPRNFAISPSGQFLLAANQNGDNIVVFRIDPAAGTLAKVGETGIGTPMCVKLGVF
jgi:6-phosphogluconolactonase